MIVSSETCSLPSNAEAAFQSPLIITFLSGGYVMVLFKDVALGRQNFVKERPYVMWQRE